MRIRGIAAVLLFSISALFAEIPTVYYIENSEVTEDFFNSIPDSLKNFTSEFDYDTVKIKAVGLPFTHYLDSGSQPGYFVINERPKEEIEILLNRLKSVKFENEVLRLHVGDYVPSFCLQNFKNDVIESDFPKKGTCYLLTFWATWCGNCLVELKPECIPDVVNDFFKYPSFRFIPICIDATSSELQEFFDGNIGANWIYLADMTYLDTVRSVNDIFASGGNLPLNVIIGKDGRVKYIHLGKISEKEDLDRLRDAIYDALSN